MNNTPSIKYFEAKEGDENTIEKQLTEWFKAHHNQKVQPIVSHEIKIIKQPVYIHEEFKTTVYNTATIQYFELTEFAAQQMFLKK